MPDLGCSANAAIAFDFLVGKGLSHEQAAGVIGNLQSESGLNPRSDAPDPTKTDPYARGRGIASWGPPRWRNLITFAAGRDPWSLDTQLDFLWHELESEPGLGLAPLRATTTVEDATVVFQNRFENPDRALAHTDKRIERARAALFALPRCRPPVIPPRGSTVAVAATVGAVVAAVGYGIYRALTRTPEPEPSSFVPTRSSWRS
jgi:hypothetical protein